MTRRPAFDAESQTARLQAAVRTHDLETLQAIVSERLLFAASRSLRRLGASGMHEFAGRGDWLNAAMGIDWVSFDILDVRSLDLGDVVVVDCRLRQVALAHGSEQPSTWVVTDVWAVEGGEWRLVARHPELASTAQDE